MAEPAPDLVFGAFVTPTSADPRRPVALAQEAERQGLDLVTFQDHPYQPGFLDTWTLLSYVAAATTSIRLAGNVLNLPLRPPAVLARSVASLDLLSGGRVELGIGAGGYWDAIEAMGAPRLSAGQSVQALGEAIDIVRGIWDAGERSVLRVDGRFHSVRGAKRGPAPAHDVQIWVGALKPRMLALVGAKADGWLPSLSYLQPGDLARGNVLVDDAATAAGRRPQDVRRLLNVMGRFDARSTGTLQGPVEQWVDELATMALEDRVSTFILASDSADDIARFAAEVAPEVRRQVADQSRADVFAPAPAAVRGPSALEDLDGLGLGVEPTPAPGARLAAGPVWDEDTRPHREPAGGIAYTDQGRAASRQLVEIHDYLRAELAQLRDLIDQVRRGTLDAGAARSSINEMTMRQNDWTLGAYCASYCRTVTLHHGIEDSAVFPHLRRGDPALGPVVARLSQEHQTIHDVLEDVDRALVAFVAEPDDFGGLQDVVDRLTDTLLSHLSYEERELLEPLARLGFSPGYG